MRRTLPGEPRSPESQPRLVSDILCEARGEDDYMPNHASPHEHKTGMLMGLISKHEYKCPEIVTSGSKHSLGGGFSSRIGSA